MASLASNSIIKFSCLFLLIALAYGQKTPTARIDAGLVVGTTTLLPAATGTVNKFLGIPFAQPPKRFSPPEALPRSNNRINATAWKPSCIQQFTAPFTAQLFNTPPPPESEDCLYLNVYAPSTPAAGKGRAVLFWIYGGGLAYGYAVFGFPSSPEINLTERNLGFLDQRFALDWVQRNIHAFGGDPSKVTIFGESAGAFSVDALLTSFPAGSSPPFRAAILQSGQYSYRGATNSVPAWYNLTTELGCPGNYGSNLTCVQAADAASIKAIIEENALNFNPVADDVTLVSQPGLQRLSGNIANIPVLGGTNAEEGRVFTVGQNNVTAYLQSILGRTNPELIPAIQAAYPLGSGPNAGYDAVAAIYTDFRYTCTQALWANDSASVGIPTWRYFFNASFPNSQIYPSLGVFHSSEIVLVFGTYLQPNTTTQQYALSQFMQSAWAKFAKNPLGGPGWNRVGTGAAGSVLVGAYAQEPGGFYQDQAANVLNGTWDVGLLGNRKDALSSGVTVIPQEEVDYKCALFAPYYQAILQAGSPPS